MKSNFLYIFFLGFFIVGCNGQSSKNITIISASDFSEKITTTPNAQIIDVRTPDEYSEQHIEKAENINWNGNNFTNKVAKFDKSKPVFVYCLSGGRSHKAAVKLAELGFTKVYDLDGGMMKWNAAGLSEPSDKIIGICSQEYAELLNSDKKVLISFYAPWCAPCKKMEPYMLQMQKDTNANYVIVRLNADENKTILKDLKIDELPTLLLYKDNKIIWKHSGFISEEDLKKQL